MPTEIKELPPIENTLSTSSSLAEHLEWQLSLKTDDDVVRDIGDAIIGNLDDDGYLVASASQPDATVEALVRDGVPVVLVNRLTDTDTPSVTSDDTPGIGAAVEHLRQLGHTAIAHLTGPPGICWMHCRIMRWLCRISATRTR